MDFPYQIQHSIQQLLFAGLIEAIGLKGIVSKLVGMKPFSARVEPTGRTGRAGDHPQSRSARGSPKSENRHMPHRAGGAISTPAIRRCVAGTRWYTTIEVGLDQAEEINRSVGLGVTPV